MNWNPVKRGGAVDRRYGYTDEPDLYKLPGYRFRYGRTDVRWAAGCGSVSCLQHSGGSRIEIRTETGQEIIDEEIQNKENKGNYCC